MAETVQQLLRERAEDDNTAVRYGEESWTWREHVAEASAVAAALIGIADTDRPMHVGTLLGNGPDMLRAMAAAALGGYTLCGINNTRRGEGLLKDLRRAECQILVTDAEHLPAARRPRPRRRTRPGHLDAGVGRPGRRRGPADPDREVEAMDTFMMIFTSGTSGDPKAVQVNHLMVLFSGLNLQGRFELGPDDVCYVAMPLFHSNAVVAGWSPAVCAGATIVPEKFSASRFLPDVRKYGVTYMNYVGKPLAYVLATPELPDDADNTLRVAFGNEASDRDIDEFMRRFACDVWDGFGSTELAVIITREPGTPKGSIGKGFDGVAIYNSETVTGVRRRRLRRERRARPTPTRRPASWSTPRAPATSTATTTTSPPTTSGCVTACTGPATSPTRTPTAGSTSPGVRRTGCGSTARTSRPRRSSGCCSGWTRSTGSRSTPCRTSTSATR